MIITIDGTAGSGKSTAAQDLAEALGYERINTGAMYRATGLLLLVAGVDIFADPPDLTRIEKLIANWTFDVTPKSISVDGNDVTSLIEGETLGQAASRVGKFKPVRRKLQAEQRRLCADKDMVCEGRDQGSVVFPDAPVKFYFTATPEARASRRISGDPTTIEYQERLKTLAKQLRQRDHEDSTRELDPLVIPDKAIEIDTTELDRAAVLELMLEVVEQCRSPR